MSVNVVFLMDTSASMCQQALVNGVRKTYLDIAKEAVETFLKRRERTAASIGDRYMLLSLEEPPNHVKAGWQQTYATFMDELKHLQSTELTSMGQGLMNAFDLLNQSRMQSGIDTYGQGRCPFLLEPSVIIVLTDGGNYTSQTGVQQQIVLPLHAPLPGANLTNEPYRWDQRVYSLVLRIPGHHLVELPTSERIPHDESNIEKMCQMTGGRSYKIRSHGELNRSIESLTQKLRPGVVLRFEQLDMCIGGGSSNASSHLTIEPTPCVIYGPLKTWLQNSFGSWPIPEPYWADPTWTIVPPRHAHPKIKIVLPCSQQPKVPCNFPIDIYELEMSSLTVQLLSGKTSNKVWPVILSTCLRDELPFGYLKPNSNHTIVYLYVLPYNYPMLLPLIDELCKQHNFNPPLDWVYRFTEYLRTIPQYYRLFLRRALVTIMNVPYQVVQYILPHDLDNCLGPAVVNQLQHMKDAAKQEQQSLCLRVQRQLQQPKPAYHQLETTKLIVPPRLNRDIVSHPMLRDAFTEMHREIVTYDDRTVVIPSIRRPEPTKNYRNPYDIPRRDLIDATARMRADFFRLSTRDISVDTNDADHCRPIADMGDYHKYAKHGEAPLRELEPTNVRKDTFGNPFKKTPKADEADLNDPGPLRSAGSQQKQSLERPSCGRMGEKRKVGPLRKDYVFKRPPQGRGRSNSCRTKIQGTRKASLSCGGELELCEKDDDGDDDDDDDDDDNNEQIEQANQETRSIVFRDIRRPGRDYSTLLQHLELVQGGRRVRKQFIAMCVREARRFRRHRMVECIQGWGAQRKVRALHQQRESEE
uniref:VWFA domain-containing protein n=1 Tax=Anopheles dirus TaxID=7168 RepID=A0A182N752_9DIPT